MSVDIFGRGSGEHSQGLRGPPGKGFKLTTDEQYDVEQKRLCNVAEPINLGDAVNLTRLNKTNEYLRSDLFTLESKITALTQDFSKHVSIQERNSIEDKRIRFEHIKHLDAVDKRVTALEEKWKKRT